MSILNVNTIQPVSAGTTVTVSSGDLIVGTDIRFGSSSGVCTATKFDGDASSLTSIPGARITGTIPVGALTNATVDLTGIRKDIATLALQVAVDTNRAAYNLTDTFIDQLEDDTGLATQTNSDYQRKRQAEYPSLVDQLDDIYHNGIDAWKATIKITKDKDPKP